MEIDFIKQELTDYHKSKNVEPEKPLFIETKRQIYITLHKKIKLFAALCPQT
jgi:hypothetical protein